MNSSLLQFSIFLECKTSFLSHIFLSVKECSKVNVNSGINWLSFYIFSENERRDTKKAQHSPGRPPSRPSPPLSAMVPRVTGNAVLILDLEVFTKTIFSGNLFPESKEVFLTNIMLAALKTLLSVWL